MKSEATKTDPRLGKACGEMESLFFHQLVKAMRSTVPRSGLLGDDKAEALYRDMMDVELSRAVTAGKGIGLSPVLIRQLNRNPGEPADEK